MNKAVATDSDNEVIRITQYEALQNDIAIAKQESQGVSFDYEDPRQNKEARSHIYGLRQLKARIESARKEAKAYALEYGRKVDSLAKGMQGDVVALIEPHQAEIDRIEQREKDRIAGHMARIDAIVTAVNTDDMTADQIGERIKEIKAITTDDMEEFADRANAAIIDTLRVLDQDLEKRRIHEAEQQELARLRAEREAREQREKEDRIRQQAVEEERVRHEREQQKKQAEIEAAERERELRERELLLKEQELEARAQAAARAEAERAEAQRKADERMADIRRKAEQGKKDMMNEMYSAVRTFCHADAPTARLVVEAIANGDIPHITTPWSTNDE